MRNWKVWAAFISIFTCGVLAGVLGVFLFMHFHFTPPDNMAEFNKRLGNRIMEDFKREVRPDEQILPQIRAILDDTLHSLEKMRQETSPKVDAIFESNRQRILQLLTKEQAARFDKLIEKHDREDRGFFHLPPPPPRD